VTSQPASYWAVRILVEDGKFPPAASQWIGELTCPTQNREQPFVSGDGQRRTSILGWPVAPIKLVTGNCLHMSFCPKWYKNSIWNEIFSCVHCPPIIKSLINERKWQQKKKISESITTNNQIINKYWTICFYGNLGGKLCFYLRTQRPSSWTPTKPMKGGRKVVLTELVLYVYIYVLIVLWIKFVTDYHKQSFRNVHKHFYFLSIGSVIDLKEWIKERKCQEEKHFFLWSFTLWWKKGWPWVWAFKS